MADVSKEWWTEVMQSTSTSKFQQFFSLRLDDESDFTIRAIVHIILTKTREEVSWFLEDSSKKQRVVEIYDLIRSDRNYDHRLGKVKLFKLIEEFNRDMG